MDSRAVTPPTAPVGILRSRAVSHRFAGRIAWFLACLLACLLALGGSAGFAVAGAEVPGDDGSVPVSPSRPSGAVPRTRVAVTTTMAGAAVADLAWSWCEPVPLYPSAGCPGSFDLTPRAMAEVEEASLVLVHDYQESLRARIAATGRPWRSLPSTGTETLPGPYLDLCGAVARALAAAFPQRAVALQSRLDELRRDLPVSVQEDRMRAGAGLHGRAVLVASFQADFVSWVGGRPAVIFGRADDISLREMDALVRRGRAAGVGAVVGNEPWGDREARALAAALGVPWTMLGNYPATAEPGAWRRLVQDNCRRLFELAGDQ